MTAPPPPPPLPYQGGAPQPHPYSAPPPKTNWWAIVSLIFGIIGGAVIALICGIVGIRKAKQYGSGRGMSIAGIVLSVLWIIAAVVLTVVAVNDHTRTATDLQVGDCLAEIPDGDRVVNVTLISCDEPHAGEVFAVLTLPDGPFPGQDEVDRHHQECGPELQRYSPQSVTDESVRLYVLNPTAETWADGDHAVTCIATLDPPRTGSLRG